MNYTPLVDQVIIAGELVIIGGLAIVALHLTLEDIVWALALRSCRKLNPVMPARRQGEIRGAE